MNLTIEDTLGGTLIMNLTTQDILGGTATCVDYESHKVSNHMSKFPINFCICSFTTLYLIT